MDNPLKIVTDADIERVHANANFGDMSKRDVIDAGVLKAAFGYSDGHTSHCILEEHGLIRRNRPRTSYPSLTKKGQRYLRAIFAGNFNQILGLRTLSNTKD